MMKRGFQFLSKNILYFSIYQTTLHSKKHLLNRI